MTNKQNIEQLYEDIIKRVPKKKDNKFKNFIITLIILALILWAFDGAKFRLVDLVLGLPQITDVIKRMFPPDFYSIIDKESYGIKGKYIVNTTNLNTNTLKNIPKGIKIKCLLDNGNIVILEKLYKLRGNTYYPYLEIRYHELINSNQFNENLKDLKDISKESIIKILKKQNIDILSLNLKYTKPQIIELPLSKYAIPDRFIIPYDKYDKKESIPLDINIGLEISKVYLEKNFDFKIIDNPKILLTVTHRLDNNLKYYYFYLTKDLNLAKLKLKLKKKINEDLQSAFINELKEQKLNHIYLNVTNNYLPDKIELPITMLDILSPFNNSNEIIPLKKEFFESLKSPKWWNNVFPNTVIGATIQTIQMALAGTIIALILAVPLAFLAARNTSPHKSIYLLVRGILNFIRTIPDLALGLIFISAVGLGAFSGTLAIAVHTMSVLAKLLSESIENIDQGIVEAIQSTGANYLQVISFGIWPQILPDLISFTLYRFETNIRSAAILGLIGAGGIGYLMTISFRTFQYNEAAAILIILIILVIIIDAISAKIRKLVI